MLRDSATLLDIVKAAQLALEFTLGLDERLFIHDIKTQSAVLLPIGNHWRSCQASFQ